MKKKTRKSELLEQAYGFYLRLLDEICDTYALEINSRASEKQLKMINTMAQDKGKLRPVELLTLRL